MARKKNTSRQPRRKATRARRVMRNGLSTPASLYAHALTNPCSGPLTSIYPGEKGTVGRYVLDASFSLSPGDTAFVAEFNPALNGAFFQTCLNGAAIVTPNITIGTGASAGYNTISAIYQKTRVVASCIEVSVPAVSALNAIGELSTFCGAGSTFYTSGVSHTVSPNDIFTISPTRYLVQRKVYEQKWAPGQMDTRYATAFDITSVDLSDTNALFVAGRGLPAASAVSIKWTLVVEGTAKRLSGLSTSAVNIRGGSHDTAHNVAAALHNKRPGWSAGVKDWFSGITTSFAQGLGQGASNGMFSPAGNPQTESRMLTNSASWGGPIIEELEEVAPLMLTL